MSDYVFLFRGGQTTLSPEEMQRNLHTWRAWMKDLTDKGHLQSGKPLQGGGKVVQGKKKTVLDGPFAEAKDLVGGFMLIAAQDLDEALELAKTCPLLDRDGVVEVRPVQVFPM